MVRTLGRTGANLNLVLIAATQDGRWFDSPAWVFDSRVGRFSTSPASTLLRGFHKGRHALFLGLRTRGCEQACGWPNCDLPQNPSKPPPSLFHRRSWCCRVFWARPVSSGWKPWWPKLRVFGNKKPQDSTSTRRRYRGGSDVARRPCLGLGR